jgi:hypothetical protein
MRDVTHRDGEIARKAEAKQDGEKVCFVGHFCNVSTP